MLMIDEGEMMDYEGYHHISFPKAFGSGQLKMHFKKDNSFFYMKKKMTLG